VQLNPFFGGELRLVFASIFKNYRVTISVLTLTGVFTKADVNKLTNVSKMRLRYNQCDVNTVVSERTPPTQAGIAYVDVYWSV